MTGGRDVWHLAATAGTVTLGAMQIGVRLLVVIVAMLLLPVAVGAVRGVAANRSLYAPLTGAVCSGARVLASAGLLDGRDATSHWARINDMEDAYPDVNWVRGSRYVDEGDVITTGGLLSNIDGTLRVIERLIGPDAARRAADVVGWRHYSPGAPASIPVLTLGPDAVLKPLNAAYRRTRTGVMLTDGVGEMELASVFDTYSGQSFATHTVAVAASRDVVSSRHGLSFVPTSDLHSVGDDLDRLVVPGADAARRRCS